MEYLGAIFAYVAREKTDRPLELKSDFNEEIDHSRLNIFFVYMVTLPRPF